MRSKTEYLTFKLPERMAFENITPQVEAVVRASGVREGLCLINGGCQRERQPCHPRDSRRA